MKGHSERIPNKNLKLLNGKPLFFWILETLKKTSFINQIVINTDSKEIADLAQKEFNAVIHWRPDELQGDFVSMNKIISYDLEKLGSQTHFLQTHSTNPLVTLPTLDEACGKYLNSLNEYDSLFSVTRHQARFYDHRGIPINHDPKVLLRTQDLAPIYEENSNFYIFSKESFKKTDARIGKTPQLFAMNHLESVDIDEMQQWKIAEALMTQK
jgi:N-acylneuraminate cytidylyltransferase